MEKSNLKNLNKAELESINGGEPCTAIIGLGILIGIAFSIWKNKNPK